MIKLIAFDFDNVLVDGESLDEIAKLVDSADEITELTKKAMEGEINFETSLKQRINLLEAVPVIEKWLPRCPHERCRGTIKELKTRDIPATITGTLKSPTE